MSRRGVLKSVLAATVLMAAGRDTTTSGGQITTVDGFLERVCQAAARCPGVSATQSQVEMCPARIRAKLSENQLATLERSTTKSETQQTCILECMRTTMCSRFGESIDNISDSDVVESFISCERHCQ